MNFETHETSQSKGELLVYQTDDGRVKLEVRLRDETVWLTQQFIADLFKTTVPNISMHVRNIYKEGELTPEATIKKFLTVPREGNRDVRREMDCYNLDMIISVGYRVKSLIATRFHIWATQRLKEYIVKGFTMDDERLKNPPIKGSTVPDYFDEMLSRIRDIRSSERRMYLRVRSSPWRSIMNRPGATKAFQHHSKQTPLCRYWYDGRRIGSIPRRPTFSQHGVDHLERRRGAQDRCHYCQKLPARKGNRRVESHRGHVAGLC